MYFVTIYATFGFTAHSGVLVCSQEIKELCYAQIIDFRVDPNNYRHWRVEYDGAIANLYMDVDEDGGLFDGYQLKLNSYDLGVDIELNDIVQRMRFEHPEVKVVVMRSAKDKVFAQEPIFGCWAGPRTVTR